MKPFKAGLVAFAIVGGVCGFVVLPFIYPILIQWFAGAMIFGILFLIWVALKSKFENPY